MSQHDIVVDPCTLKPFCRTCMAKCVKCEMLETIIRGNIPWHAPVGIDHGVVDTPEKAYDRAMKGI